MLQVDKPNQTVLIEEKPEEDQVKQLANLLCSFNNIFTFSHEEMLGIDPAIELHSLNVRLECKAIK